MLAVFQREQEARRKFRSKDAAETAKKTLDVIQLNARGSKGLAENIRDVATYEEFKTVLGGKDDSQRGGGFLRSPWCGKTSCEDAIKEDTSADIRVIPDDESVQDGSKCVYCKEPAIHVPLFARGY